MSDNPQEWVWQGFEGPAAAATTGKAATDADARVAAWAPAIGAPPMPWNRAGTRCIWAVMTRRGNPVPVPAGCEEADPALVGRMVGA